MDGVASASLYTYLVGGSYEIIFAEPYNLHKVLYKVYKRRPSKVFLFDLGPNPNYIDFVAGVVELLTSRGAEVQWFDHHVWNSEWVERLSSAGAKLYIDRSTCATGVVAKYVKPCREIDKGFVEELVAGVCGADLWRFDHRLSPFYLRLVRRGDTNDWRMKVYNTLSKGVLWTKEFEEVVIERFDEELKELSKNIKTKVFEVNNIRFAVTLKNSKVENSFLAARVMGLTNADVAIVVDKSGKLSLRSRGVNVRDLAVALGGGGHPKAAGAKIDIPLKIKILSLFTDDAILTYVSNVVKSILSQHREIK